MFLLRKIPSIFLTLFVLASLSFLLMRTVPGGPFDSEKSLPPEIKANIEAKYQLNQPIWRQYTQYLGSLARGDFGPSYKYIGRSVNEIIAESLPTSIVLGVYALLFALLLGLPLGVLSAYKQNTWLDFSSMFFAVAGVSAPNYLVAALLIYVFFMRLNWLPPAIWKDYSYSILPTITLGMRPAALIARLTRAALLESIHADYVRTARAKGLGEFAVIMKHALRNSLIPVITLLGPLTAYLVSGTFVVEYIFAIPGMGRHFINAVSNCDYPLIMGVTIIYGIILIMSNLLVDLAYRLADPRVRLS